MDGSTYYGLVAIVAAASGSVVLVALEAHRRLLSDFRKKLEIELGGTGGGDGRRRKPGKRVRFADDVAEPSSDNQEYRRRHAVAMMQRMRASASRGGVCI